MNNNNNNKRLKCNEVGEGLMGHHRCRDSCKQRKMEETKKLRGYEFISEIENPTYEDIELI